MATDSWNGNSDNWTTAADWSTGAVPQKTDDVDIESGDPQVSANVGTVNSVYDSTTLTFLNSGSLAVAGGFYGSGTVNIDSQNSSGGSSLSVGGTLTNAGSLNIGASGISVESIVSTSSVNNTGSINIVGNFSGSSAQNAAVLSIGGPAGLGTSGAITGTVAISYNADLQFGSGAITSIAGNSSLTLDGPQANISIAGSQIHNSAITSLAANNGTLNLYSVGSQGFSGPFVNDGSLSVANTGLGSSNLNIGGALTNGSSNIYGLLYLSGGSVTASSVNNGTDATLDFVASNASGASTSQLILQGGSSTIGGIVEGTGNLDFEGGSALVSSGTSFLVSSVTLGGASNVEIATQASNLKTTFGFDANSTATLKLDASVLPAAGGTLSSPIVRFAAGDVVDLASLSYSPTALATYDNSSHILTVVSGNSTDQLTLNLPQSTNFQAVSDGNGGTDVVVCFASGTHILTSRGDTVVDQLSIGEMAVTSSGDCRRVVWIGSRQIRCASHPQPANVLPIRIKANAFANRSPARDLVVSPGHAICVDAVGEVLIPAAALVNGTTIVQEQVDTVTYWHVELEGGHDIILAENLPCESYIEMGNRSFFAEAKTTTLHASPDTRIVTHADFCRPFHQDGPVVAFVRERLAARAPDLGWTLKEESFANLHLVVDGQRLEATTHDLCARFLVPSDAKEAWLVSDTSVPAEIGMAPDLRSLGVCVSSLVIDDGFETPRTIAADHPLLSVGFHHIEEGPQRWTAGRSRLPAELWDSCRGSFFLRVELTRPALPRWVAPATAVREDFVKLAG